jgi:histidine triad (HIT) family protein
MEDCIFCAIVAGKIPANRVFENGDFTAFLDKSPIFKGHTLLIPKKHIETIFDFPDKELGEMIKNAKYLSIAIKKAVPCDGILFINNNVISQSVPHFHMHIIPRKEGEILRGFMWPRTKYKEGEEKEFADRIREEISKTFK